jgi:hypothetical protein
VPGGVPDRGDAGGVGAAGIGCALSGSFFDTGMRKRESSIGTFSSIFSKRTDCFCGTPRTRVSKK